MELSARYRTRGVTPEIMVIGCGTVFERYYRSALRKLEARGIAQVVAFVDPDPGRILALESSFPSARPFPTPAAALEGTRPDLTIVASPPNLHAAHTVAALAAGSHVLCEKPMAAGVEDAERMLAAARSSGLILAIGMTRRMYPCLAEARALLADGALGDRLRFVYREGEIYGWPVSTDFAFRRASAGGGVLIDKGTHVLDFLAAIFGPPSITAYADDAHADGVETNCRIDLAFREASGVVQLSWSQVLANGLHIAGSAGELSFHPWRLDAVRWRRSGGAWETRVSKATWPDDLRPRSRRATPWTYDDCVYHQIVQVLRAAAHGETVPVDAEQGLMIMRAVQACYARATPLRLPWLEPAEQAQADARHWSRARCAAA